MSHLNTMKTLLFLFILFFGHHILANSYKITLATDSFEPYYGPKLVNNGYVTQQVKEAFKRKGYELTIKFVPWKRALEHSKLGNYDGLLGAYYKKERTTFFVYSEKIDQTQIVFFTKKSRNIQYNKFTDLSKYVIGVVRAYHYTKEFDISKKYLHIFEANHLKQNIKLLIHDRVDLILGSKKVIVRLLNQHYPQYVSEVKFITPILQSNKLYVTISKKRKNYKKIINDFNEGLKEIIEDGTYNKILKFHNFQILF